MNNADFRNHFDTYRPVLCMFAERLIGNSQVAEDLVTDVFVKLFQAQGKGEITNVRAYLYRATKNACISYRKKDGYIVSGLPDGVEFIDNRSADMEMIKAERYRQLLEAVERLPDQCRKVVRMAYFDAKKSQEIASAMNISESTVNNHKARGIKILRKKLDDIYTILTLVKPF